MTTKTQSIVVAIAAALTGAGITVREDTEALFSFETKPCIVVDCGDEICQPVIGSMVYWDLTVTLMIGADGPVPKLAPEPTRAAAHAALYVDRTLGGLVIDISIGQVNRAIDVENPAAGITQATYLVKYRALEGVV
jgi:hypothetical protein